MWFHLLSALLGIWLMAAPAVLGYDDPANTNDRIAGPIAATCGILAIWEITRPARRLNTVVGGWLLLAPWILGYDTTETIANDMVVGALILGLSFVRGKITQPMGGGWSSLWQENPMHERAAAAPDGFDPLTPDWRKPPAVE